MKRGFINSVTGLVYWGAKKAGRRGDVWLTLEQFEAEKQRRRERDRAFDKANPGVRSAKTKKWQKDNPEKNKKLRARMFKRRYYGNPFDKFRTVMRNRLVRALGQKRFQKRAKTFKLIGCTPEFLRAYLTARFEPGMSWDNYGEWHVDHVIPLSSATTQRELEKLCHYTNLQPLWAADNYRKSSKLPVQPELLL